MRNYYLCSERSKHVYQYVNRPEHPKHAKWFFGDETEQEHGPYNTEEEAYTEFTRYCEECL